MHQAHAIHPRRRWLQLDWHDPYWHGWAASSVLLAAGLAGLTQAYFVVMALAPWNRTRPFTLALLRRALFTPPRPGAVID